MNRAVSLLVLLATCVVLFRANHRSPLQPLDGPALAMGERLDLDVATASELEALPGIGPSLARRIVDAQPFDGVDDLQRVRGIGPVTASRVAPFVE